MEKLPVPNVGCAQIADPSPHTKSVEATSTDTLSESASGLMSTGTLSESDPEVGGAGSEVVASVNPNCVWGKSTVGIHRDGAGSYPGAESAADAKPSKELPASPSVRTKQKGGTVGGGHFGLTAVPLSKLRNAAGPFL